MSETRGATERERRADVAGEFRLAVRILLAAVLILAAAPAPPASAQDPVGVQPTDHWKVLMSRASLSSASPEEGVAGAQAICDYLLEEYDAAAGTHGEVRAEIAPSIESIERGLSDGSVNYAFVSPMEWLRLQERADAELIAITTPEGSERLTRAALLVRADDPAQSITDLKGRTFARSGATSTVGFLFPQWLLLSSGLPTMDLYFGRVVDVRGDKSAFYAVALGDADCAAVDESLLRVLRELSPGVAKKCRVLEYSQPMPTGVVAASRRNTKEGMKIVLQSIARGAGAGQKRVREAMHLVRIGGLAIAQPEDFDYARKLWMVVNDADWRSIDPVCGKECLPGPEQPTEMVGETTVAFCSAACRDVYRGRKVAGRAGSPDHVFVLGVSRPLWAERKKWADAVTASSALFDEIAKRIGVRFAIEVYPKLEALEARAREGTMALVNVPATDYLRLHRTIGAEPLVRPVFATVADRVVLVAKSPNHRNGVAGLRGRKIAFSRSSDVPTYSYLRHLTHGLGNLEPEDVFSQLIQCPSDISSVRAVSMGQADAALVSDASLDIMREYSPGVLRELERVVASQDLMSGPICVLPNVDPADAERIRKAIVNLGDCPEGRQLMTLFGCSRLVPATDRDYTGTRALVGDEEKQ